jgi:hypothetical protein
MLYMPPGVRYAGGMQLRTRAPRVPMSKGLGRKAQRPLSTAVATSGSDAGRHRGVPRHRPQRRSWPRFRATRTCWSSRTLNAEILHRYRRCRLRIIVENLADRRHLSDHGVDGIPQSNREVFGRLGDAVVEERDRDTRFRTAWRDHHSLVSRFEVEAAECTP